MSQFIKDMFCIKVDGKPVVGEISFKNLAMEYSCHEAMSVPKQIINFSFTAQWEMNASSTSEEFPTIHKIALKALKRSVYGEFYESLTRLHLALYDCDLEKAKKIIENICKEIEI